MASVYHSQELDPSRAPQIKKLITRVDQFLKKHRIARRRVVMVGMGVSGVALSSILAYALHTKRGFVRKRTDTKHHSVTSHSALPLDHSNNPFVIFVDDLVASGGTLRYVQDCLEPEGIPVSAVATENRVGSGIQATFWHIKHWIHGE